MRSSLHQGKPIFLGSPAHSPKKVAHKNCDGAALASHQSQREPVDFDTDVLATKKRYGCAYHRDRSLVASHQGQQEPVDVTTKMLALKPGRSTKHRLNCDGSPLASCQGQHEPIDFDVGTVVP